MVPKVVTWKINVDPHHRQAQGLAPIPTANGVTMWVQTNLVEGEQWNTTISKKKKRMEENLVCHVIAPGTGEYNTSTSLLIDSEGEQIVLMVI